VKTLRRSINKAEVGGEPLPPPFQAFQREGIILRRAEVTIIAGTPGAGKSSIALHIAARLKQPTLYFSADTNVHTMAMRLLAMKAKITQQEAEYMLKTDGTRAEEYLREFSGMYHHLHLKT
jgi:predicted ATP-dependent serine protease